jgi:hypothetical protein
MFLLFRVVSLHAISHSIDEKEVAHCEECALITVTQKGIILDFAPNTELKIVNPIISKFNIVFTDYKIPDQKALLSDYFHNKPPPSLLRG